MHNSILRLLPCNLYQMYYNNLIQDTKHALKELINTIEQYVKSELTNKDTLKNINIHEYP